ncbi:hypothetical protein Cgig2_015085 [Carnegiea gigantea]|uniref:Gibberellin 20-oxidase n=1 Tax=Carnegiea gigantea TaxID=171969 RepID=A0A9Q1KS88_9CARY|nr:hypothetical protein Cgig2_015085 [Carnegiea gigantea]
MAYLGPKPTKPTSKIETNYYFFVSNLTAMSSKGVLVFDPSMVQTQPTLPKEFIWVGAKEGFMNSTENSNDGDHELNEPLVDLEGFFKGDEEGTKRAAELINKACVTHGFFQVMNHRVNPGLIRAAHDQLEGLFKLPLEKKLRVQRKAGDLWGYSGAHTDRFSKELPWKETFSFGYHFLDGRSIGSDRPIVVDYFKSTLGGEFKYAGWVYQRYCEAMKKLSLVIFELLAISLGAQCNGRYKSCLHRAVVNKERERRSLAFFVSPREDKVVRPPQDLFDRDEGDHDQGTRRYPDFKWTHLLEFTQKHHRADFTTLQCFFQWLPSSNLV